MLEGAHVAGRTLLGTHGSTAVSPRHDWVETVPRVLECSCLSCFRGKKSSSVRKAGAPGLWARARGGVGHNPVCTPPLPEAHVCCLFGEKLHLNVVVSRH